MWPYDYFNIYSGLINEFDEDLDQDKRNRKIFLIKWYGDKDHTEESRGGQKEVAIKKVIEKITVIKDIYTNYDGIAVDKLRYNLKTIMPEGKEGDLNLEILGKIIESSFVICDVTPTNLSRLSKKRLFGKRALPEFNANVMAELGLAIAWKMPEQVVIIYDQRFSLKEYKLPFDIQGYFVHAVDFKDLENSNKNKHVVNLKTCIEDRIKDVDFKKNMLIRNVISKLDEYSLSLLDEVHGLMFTARYRPDSHFYQLEIGAIRSLLNLGIFRIEIFSSNPVRTCGYCVTDFGRIVLDELSIKLYDKMFTEFMRVSYWMRDYKNNKIDEKNFNEKKEHFHINYGSSWDDCDNKLKRIIKNQNKDIAEEDQVITMFNKYCEGKKFEDINEEIVKVWCNGVAKIKHSVQ